MTPYYADDWLTVYHGDCRAVMSDMEPGSVHCVVTSPPYWGLRDYGDPGQLGLEPTPEAYVANLVAVFREVRRVLRADGTVWLNLGDSYTPDHAQKRNAGWKGEGPSGNSGIHANVLGSRARDSRGAPPGLKPKDLVGIPWRVAFALQADGWYLRSDIIWSKPNPMPESVTDRPTKSHEYLFLLSKSPRYFFDADAVREPHERPELLGKTRNVAARKRIGVSGVGLDRVRDGVPYGDPAGRNIRSVWTIATAPYSGSHFATFPPKLVEPCIKAGTSEKGVCPECGAPWVRVTSTTRSFESGSGRAGNLPVGKNGANLQGGGETIDVRRGPTLHVETTGWRPTCPHVTSMAARLERIGADQDAVDHARRNSEPYSVEPVPATVLDPFAGSGTTGLVAQSLSRRAVLIDLSLNYLGQLMNRNADIPLGLGA